MNGLQRSGALRIEGLVFAEFASRAPALAAFFRDVLDTPTFDAPDGRVFELIDRRA